MARIPRGPMTTHTADDYDAAQPDPRKPPHRQTRSTWPSKIGWPNRLASVASSSRTDCSPNCFC